MAVDAFDLAERLQTPVFVMTDLDLGMNNWMADPFPYPEKPARPRQGALEGGPRPARRLRPLQGRGRRRHRLAHAARHRPPEGRLLHARHRATTRTPPTPRARSSSSGTWSGSRASSRRPAPSCRRRSAHGAGGARVGHHRLRLVAPRHRRGARAARAGARPRDGLPARARPTRSRARSTSSWSGTSASTSSSRTATAQLAALLKLDLAPELVPAAPRRRPRPRAAARRALGHRRDPRRWRGGRPWRRARPPPAREDEPPRPHRRRLPRRQDHPVRRLRPQRHLRADPRGDASSWASRPSASRSSPGIGCSSKSPAYFMNRSHAFNAVHGRMPSVATGAVLANRTLLALGVSGDGDTASIGIGQFVHLMRRNLPHRLRHREQRRVRPHQGAVLGDRRRRARSSRPAS